MTTPQIKVITATNSEPFENRVNEAIKELVLSDLRVSDIKYSHTSLHHGNAEKYIAYIYCL